MFGSKGGIKEVTISARRIKADGTIEDLGVISKTKPKKKKRKDDK